MSVEWASRSSQAYVEDLSYGTESTLLNAKTVLLVSYDEPRLRYLISGSRHGSVRTSISPEEAVRVDSLSSSERRPRKPVRTYSTSCLKVLSGWRSAGP